MQELPENEQKPSTMSEYALYSNIEAQGGRMFYYRHDWYDGRFGMDKMSAEEFEQTMQKMQDGIAEFINQTVRFDVEAPVRDEAGQANESYWAWYRPWNEWEKGLSEDEFNRVQQLVFDGHGAKIVIGMDVSEENIQALMGSEE